MGARVSAEMKRAQELLQNGYCAAEAARIAGITKSAISKSAVCQLIINKYKMETRIDTVGSLKSFFFDSVFSAHKDEYPSDMSRDEFGKKLEAYRDGMNQHNGCEFPSPAARSVEPMCREYKAAKTSKAT